MSATLLMKTVGATAKYMYNDIRGIKRSDFKEKLNKIDKQLQDVLVSIHSLINIAETSHVKQYVKSYSEIYGKINDKYKGLENRSSFSTIDKLTFAKDVGGINNGGDELLHILRFNILGGETGSELDTSLVQEYSKYLLRTRYEGGCIMLQEYVKMMLELLYSTLSISFKLMTYYVVASEIVNEEVRNSTLNKFDTLFTEIIEAVEKQHFKAFELFNGLFYERELDDEAELPEKTYESYKTLLKHRQSGKSLDGDTHRTCENGTRLINNNETPVYLVLEPDENNTHMQWYLFHSGDDFGIRIVPKNDPSKSLGWYRFSFTVEKLHYNLGGARLRDENYSHELVSTGKAGDANYTANRSTWDIMLSDEKDYFLFRCRENNNALDATSGRNYGTEPNSDGSFRQLYVDYSPGRNNIHQHWSFEWGKWHGPL